MAKNYVIRIDKDGNHVKDKKVPLTGSYNLNEPVKLKGVKIVDNSEYIETMYNNGTIYKMFEKE